VCIDYDKFDAHMSSGEIFNIKALLSRQTPYTDLHLEYESYDYPLIESKSGKRMLDRCDKLASGDYITSFASTQFQISTYKMLSKYIEVKDFLCGGDDGALLLDVKNVDAALSAFSSIEGKRVALAILSDKSISKAARISRYIELFYKYNTRDEIQQSKSFLNYVAYNRRI